MRRVCYYVIPRNSSRLGPSQYQLQPENIDSYLCTHIIIGAAGVHDSDIVLTSPNDIKVLWQFFNGLNFYLKKHNHYNFFGVLASIITTIGIFCYILLYPNLI